MSWACGMYGGGAYHGLVGKSLGNRPLRRPRVRWVECIKMELKKTVWEKVGWSDDSDDGQMAGCCKQGNEPSISTKCR
jgi:hypothetical protein